MPQHDVENDASGLRKWAITGTIVAILLGAMYGVTAHRLEVQDEHRQIELQNDASPSVTKPGG